MSDPLQIKINTHVCTCTVSTSLFIQRSSMYNVYHLIVIICDTKANKFCASSGFLGTNVQVHGTGTWQLYCRGHQDQEMRRPGAGFPVYPLEQLGVQKIRTAQKNSAPNQLDQTEHLQLHRQDFFLHMNLGPIIYLRPMNQQCDIEAFIQSNEHTYS